MKAIGGISGLCKIVYDQWYKNRQKSVSFSGHISDGLSVVSIRAEPHKGYRRGMENLVTKVTGSAERYPGGTLPLP